MNATYRRATGAVSLVGVGVLAAAGNFCVAQNADNGQDANSSNPPQRQGFLSGLGQALGIPSRKATTQPAAAHSDVDTSGWDTLGIKLGDSPEAAEAAIKQKYPKAVRVDHEVHYAFQHFSTPVLVLGTQYVAGKAVSDIMSRSGQIVGAQELGNEGDKIDVEYIWPSKGAVVAVRRSHLYDSSRRLNARTLPSVDSIKKALFDRFGPPIATDTTAATGTGGLLMGGTFPTITWTWADSPIALRGNTLAPQCTNWRIFQFSSRNDPAGIIALDPKCGSYLTVSLETVDNDYVETLTQTMVNGRAVSEAFLALGNYFQTGATDQSNAMKAHADEVKPTL